MNKTEFTNKMIDGLFPPKISDLGSIIKELKNLQQYKEDFGGVYDCDGLGEFVSANEIRKITEQLEAIAEENNSKY